MVTTVVERDDVMTERNTVPEKAQRTRSGSRREPGTVSLLAEILTGRPNLPEARCRTHAELFDALVDGRATDEDKNYARGLCGRCPHLTECPDALTAPHRKAASWPTTHVQSSALTPNART